MTEPNSQTEKPKDQRRLDPKLLKRGLRCDRDQYEMLNQCLRDGEEGIKRWNKWRQEHLNEEIFLEGANFQHWVMKKINLMQYEKIVSLKKANFVDADLEESHFMRSNLENVDFEDASLPGTFLSGANLQGASFKLATVDSRTVIWKPKVNHYSNKREYTDFTGVSLDILRVDPGTKQLLEYNIRRKNWEEWYNKGRWWQRILRRLLVWPFWLISDYGLRIWRIIVTFFGLAFGFGLVYWLCPSCVLVNGTIGDIRGLWHALYFSVVTMTTLGFGDIAANPDSWLGQTLLMAQVILGYVLLGALVTRFAVLFTAGGPAGRFEDDKEKEDKREPEAKDEISGANA
jgi:hypothetical protein